MNFGDRNYMMEQQHGKSQSCSFLVENAKYFARKTGAYAPRGVGC